MSKSRKKNQKQKQKQKQKQEEKQNEQKVNHGQRFQFNPIYFIIICGFLLASYGQVTQSVTVIDVYRLAQYDISGVPYGSRRASFTLHAVSSLFSPNASDPSRCVLVLPLRELNISFLEDYVLQKKPIGALLLLLPPVFHPEKSVNEDRTYHDTAEEHLRNSLAEVEKLLIHANIPYPVYFGFEDETINAVLADVKKNDATGQPASASGGFRLVVSVPDPKKVESPSITHFEGALKGKNSKGASSEPPLIAIVASYDTFWAAPALSVGSDSNGSGVVALLEIARLFSILYSSVKTRGGYHLLFALTSGGPYNYVGTQKWLKSRPPGFRDSIDFAICLNSIGSLGNELWVHVSKDHEQAYENHMFEDFSSVADELGLKIGLKHQDINISNPRVAWEHEQFSRWLINGATISALPAAPELLERAGSISDNRQSVSEASIRRNVKLVAESLVRHIYGKEGKNVDIFAEHSSLAINPSYIRSWLNLLSTTPRVAPYLSKKDKVIEALEKELEDHTGYVIVQNQVLDGMFTFYDTTTAKLKINKILSIYTDFLLMLGILSYLAILYSILVITTRGLGEFLNLFYQNFVD